jgi:hypothetical protein
MLKSGLAEWPEICLSDACFPRRICLRQVYGGIEAGLDRLSGYVNNSVVSAIRAKRVGVTMFLRHHSTEMSLDLRTLFALRGQAT